MGKQEANIYEIAREAGVSIATVSRVINHSNAVSEKSYRRVMDAVRKFNYVPNSTARSLSTSTSTSIGVVIPDINNPFFSLLLEGITRVADERGYHVLLFNTAENTDREHQVLQTMREHRLRGIIITPVSEQDPDTMKRLHNFETLGIPVVLLDREVDSQFFDRVVTDDERGVYAAVSELIRVGPRRIAIITGPEASRPGRERLRGYYRALREHGLPVTPAYIRKGDFMVDCAYEQTLALCAMQEPPTAVFSSNNMTTYGCLKAFNEQGPTSLWLALMISTHCAGWITTFPSSAVTCRKWASRPCACCCSGLKASGVSARARASACRRSCCCAARSCCRRAAGHINNNLSGL